MKNKVFIISISILTFLVFPVFSNASTIFADDFNSYSNGNIEGQGYCVRLSLTQTYIRRPSQKI